MHITVVTVSLNSENTIEDTIRSVLSQKNVDIEYIVVDGLSSDSTCSIIKKYASHLRFVSEPDKGLYDAINKGIQMSNGDVVAILNSDDVYIHDFVLYNVANSFNFSCSDVVYGNLYYVEQDNIDSIVRKWNASKKLGDSFYTGWHPPHPAMFVKRSVYKNFGNYNLQLKSASDYEFMLRIFEKNSVSSFYLDEYLVKMRIGGKSNKNLKNILISNYECYLAWKINGLPINIFQLMRRPFSKIKQFFY